MRENVKEWLASATKTEEFFASGLDLLRKSGIKFLANRLASRRMSQMSWDKLVYELQKRAGLYQPIQPNQPRAASKDVHLVEARDLGDVSQSSDPALSLVVEFPLQNQGKADHLARKKSRLHGERAKLSNTLADFAMNDDAGRAEACAKIKALTKQMNDIRLEQAGEAPEPEKPKPLRELPTEIADLVRAQNNTRSNISKTKARLKRCQVGSSAWTNATAKLEEHKAHLERIKEALQ